MGFLKSGPQISPFAGIEMGKTLSGKAIMVTGAGSGIGRATCLVLAREGARVMVTDVDEAGGRETVEMGKLFGQPAFRWLPAKSKIGSRYLLFYTRVPEGFSKVDDVRHESGSLIIEDKRAGKTIHLAASLTL